ncbi:aldo/keto reductase [Acinetobacter sp.]|uniref:aldo/keto reductase n=1 Tax=Acinetobacter sp. TaxID=472 RepID=UPI000C5A5833|nr:aldo/keto reductase [Acinetobacter sp.]MBC70009.1 hypothetical protein [Acinetobacter sp.]
MKSYKSKFVLGTWPLSGDYGRYSEKNLIEVLNTAIDNKIHEIDTAPNYGKGIVEKVIGNEIKDNLIINTKVGSLTNKKKSFKLNDIERSFYQSLERLKRNSINILFVHNPRVSDYQLHVILELLKKIKEDNLVKSIGISLAKNFKYSHKTLQAFDVVQDDLNLLDLSYMLKKNKYKRFQARSILASGLLSLRLNNQSRFNRLNDHRASWIKGPRLDYLNQHIKQITDLLDMPLENFSRRFILQQTYVNKCVFGVRTKSQLLNLLEDINFNKINNNLVDKIVKIYKKYSINKELKY